MRPEIRKNLKRLGYMALGVTDLILLNCIDPHDSFITGEKYLESLKENIVEHQIVQEKREYERIESSLKEIVGVRESPKSLNDYLENVNSNLVSIAKDPRYLCFQKRVADIEKDCEDYTKEMVNDSQPGQTASLLNFWFSIGLIAIPAIKMGNYDP